MITKSTEEIDILIQKEQPGLYRFACYKTGNTEDASDILQDVFLKIYSQSMRLLNIQNIQSYLYRSVSNACSSFYRQQAKKKLVPFDQVNDVAEEADEDFKEEYQRINRLLTQIPEEQAEVIRLRIICDKSIVDIADILELPVTTVKSRFKYGIDKIRSEFFNPNKQKQ